MLIRVNGGKKGIKEYLEEGQKVDRFFSRDDLDERLILHGDLSAANDLIKTIDNNGEKYFHITLSFKENHLSHEMLSNISKEFKEFYFNAFNDDEIIFYSEAHLPRIKSYTDKSGNIIERKPHIHVVIPKINMMTGQLIDFKESINTKYINAFQEYINNKYGLESPKDNRRYKVNDSSEYIARYNGDGFKGKGKNFKVTLLDEIIQNNISNLHELYGYLEHKNYTVKIRNATHTIGDQYINIMLPDGNINLRDIVFRNEFLQLDNKTKIKFLTDSNQQLREYIEPKTGSNNIDDVHQKFLTEWNELKSLECKYTRNFSNKQRENYNQLSYDDKVQLLTNLHESHQQKIKPKLTLESYQNVRAKHNSREYSRVNDLIMESTRSNIKVLNDTLSGRCGTERVHATERWRSELKRRYRANYEQGSRGERGYRNHQNGGDNRKLNPDSSVMSSGKYQYDKSNPDTKNMYKQFNKEIKADVLLELLEKTHGINPELYRITVSKDGSDRIGVGSRNYSLLDFCAHEINLTMNESIKILQNALQLQQEVNRKHAYINADGKYLLNEYSSWIESYKKERINLLSTNKANQRKIKEEIKQKYADKISAIRINKSIPFHKKREIIQATRFEQMTEFQSINKMTYQLNIDTRKNYNLEMQQAYRVFLMRKAMKENDERALQELRRLRINYEAYTETLTFNYTTRYNEFKIPLSHEIDKDGVIHYKVNDTTVIKDHGVRVEVVKTKDEYLEMSFKLAQQKFGNKISLRGKEQFRKSCVEFAIKNGYKVEFIDDFSREYHQKLLKDLQNKSSLWLNHSKNIISDSPDKLIVKHVNLEQSLLNGKAQSINEVTLINPDTNKEYKLANAKLHFIVQKINVGDFVDAYLDKNTNEVMIKLANNSRIKNKIKQDLIEERKIDFKQHVDTVYPNNSSEYYGKIIKSRVNQNKPWILLKTASGDCVKFNNPDVILQLKSCNIGDYVSIINVGTKDVEINKQSAKTTVQRYPSIFQLTARYKSTKMTIIGEILKQTEFKHHDNKLAYRVLVNNLTTGKKEIIFSNHKIDAKNGDYVALDKISWNNFKVKTLDNLNQELVQYKCDKNVTVGTILSMGETNIRGKDIFHVEVQTIDGVVKKYGENLKYEITAVGLKVSDSVRIERHDTQVSEMIKQNLFESKNLSQNLDNEILNRKNQYSLSI